MNGRSSVAAESKGEQKVSAENSGRRLSFGGKFGRTAMREKPKGRGRKIVRACIYSVRKQSGEKPRFVKCFPGYESLVGFI